MNEEEKKEVLTSFRIHGLSHEGRGIAKDNTGKMHFIYNALPGELVQTQILNTHKNYTESIALSIEEAHPQRVLAPCDYYLDCGGCRLQHIQPETQIVIKEKALYERLAHANLINPSTQILPALKGESDLSYRYKARLHVFYSPIQKKMILGFRSLKNPAMITPIKNCIILHPCLNELLAPVTEMLGQLSNFQSINHITFISSEVGQLDSGRAIVFEYHFPFTKVDLKRLEQFSLLHKVAIYFLANGMKSVKLLSDQPNHEFYYTLAKYQLRLNFEVNDFVQVNFPVNEMMVEQAIKLLEINRKDKVLDCYCGIGNFSLPAARFAKSVLGLEGNNTSIHQAKKNAQLNHIKNIEFKLANLTKDFTSINNFKPNKVILDPPRAGALKLLTYLVAFKPQAILYISCNPATFVRDAQFLVQQDYEIAKVGSVDMFPHTEHLEIMALFFLKS